MAIFTGTPVEIAPTPFLPLQSNVDNPGVAGPLFYEGAIYVVGYKDASHNYAGVAKSTDGGATWTIFYQSGSEGWSPMPLSKVLDPSPGAGKIIFVGNDAFVTGNFSTFYFDLETETFSSVTDSGFSAQRDTCIVRRSNGDVIAFYSPNTDESIEFVQITANAFGTPAVLDDSLSDGSLRMRAVVMGSGDTCHILYRHAGATLELCYNTLSSGNSPGTRVTVDISSSGYFISNMVLFGDSIIAAEGLITIAAFYEGTPISGPSWTRRDLHALTTGLVDNEVIAVSAGSTVKFLYQHKDSPVTILEIMQVQWNGSTLDTPQVFWDIVANPPPGASGVSVANLDTDGITAYQASGSLGVAVSATVDMALDLSAVWLSVSVSTQRINRMY